MIEQLRSEDLKEAAEIYSKTIEMENPPGYLSIEEAIQQLQKNFVHKRYHVFVSKDDETKRINGILIFRMFDKKIKIFFIGTYPTGKGIGTNLMKKLSEFAISHSVSEIISNVSAFDERAMNFYFEKCGFRKIKEYEKKEAGFRGFIIKVDPKKLFRKARV